MLAPLTSHPPTSLVAASGDWFFDTSRDLWAVPVAALLMLVVVIVVVRIIGLRSFSKMSGFDFAVTVSIGSLLASAATSSVPLVNAALAAASLLGVQAVIAWARSRRDHVADVIDNTPMLLMDGPTMLDDNLASARVTRGDVVAKLREANVIRLADVRAVVLETTGDISVLHGSESPDPEILDGVRRDASTEGSGRD